MGRMSKYSATFKAQVALAVLRGEETIQSIAKRYEVSPSEITEWMREYEEEATQAFKKPSVNTKYFMKTKSENKHSFQFWDDDYEEPTYERYNGSYAQDVEGWSDQDIDDVFNGDPDAYWNID
ncbi:transposase [Porphyromonas levii]|uniref:transposase n=1 Tax=Porphyromonas levii TaxID=28114 RepID=UPI001BAC6BE5|nr:transposase [Porphyromonas levii]MBR8803432.1 hypothetical protein [Porphyromonas levii]